MTDSLNNPTFVVYAISCLVLCLNLLALWGYSGAVRGKTKTAINKEDSEKFGAALKDLEPAGGRSRPSRPRQRPGKHLPLPFPGPGLRARGRYGGDRQDHLRGIRARAAASLRRVSRGKAALADAPLHRRGPGHTGPHGRHRLAPDPGPRGRLKVAGAAGRRQGFTAYFETTAASATGTQVVPSKRTSSSWSKRK
jgi:hypothetical protein